MQAPDPDPGSSEPADPEPTSANPGEGAPADEVPAAPQGVPAQGSGAEEAFSIPEKFHDQETQQLVDRAKSGDVDALNRLFTRYHGFVVDQARRRLGARLRLKEEPDDLAQTTFREATRDFSAYEYRGEGSLVRWLMKILQNKIRDKAEFYSAGKRDLSRERAMEERPAGRDSDSSRFEPRSVDLTVTAQVQQSESFAILRGALGQLSPEHRKAITLVFFEGLSLREAGKRLDGRSEDAVRMLLRRAEAKLNEITGRELKPEK